MTNPKENTDLKEQISRILGEPATTTRGQGGLPLHGTVEDYSMYFTKDGKQHLVNQLVELVHQARVAELESLLKLTQGVYDTRSPFVTIENISESMVTATNSMIQARLANLEKSKELESKEDSI